MIYIFKQVNQLSHLTDILRTSSTTIITFRWEWWDRERGREVLGKGRGWENHNGDICGVISQSIQSNPTNRSRSKLRDLCFSRISCLFEQKLSVLQQNYITEKLKKLRQTSLHGEDHSITCKLISPVIQIHLFRRLERLPV